MGTDHPDLDSDLGTWPVSLLTEPSRMRLVNWCNGTAMCKITGENKAFEGGAN